MEDHNIVRTNEPQTRARFYEQTDAHAPLNSRQFVAGYIQHPATMLYQVWLSTNGLDLIYLSAHQRETDAENDVQVLKTTLSSQDIYNEAKLAELFKKLASSGEKTQPLPDGLVKKII